MSFTTGKMIHLRSASDPPLLSPSTLGPGELANRPVTPSAPSNAQAYAKRPLPPLPPPMINSTAVPPPLNIKKGRKNKPASLPVGPRAPSLRASDNGLQVDSRSASPCASPHASPRASPRTSPRAAPSPPAKNSLPPRLSSLHSLPSPVFSIKKRTSKKVMQLMGHDIDVMNGGIAPQEAEKETISRSSRNIDGPPNLNSTTLLHLPEENLIPVLEDDDGMDSMSSKKSSWGPGSPHSASAFPLGHQQSVRRRRSARIFDHDDSGLYIPQEDTPMPSNLDLNDEDLSDDDDMAAGEYHKFAAELAASAGAKTSHEEARPVTASKGRRSSIMSFTSGNQFSRLRRRPTTAERPGTRMGSSSSAEIAAQALAALAPEPEEPAVPKSAFDDSDSESDHTSSKSRWRRDRSANKAEDRGRDRGRDSPASMTRREDESSRSRGWAKTGDQMKGLLTVGKRRKEQQQAKREMGVVNESVFA
ncbi:hypothetical protein ACHAQJ_007035 [Trichoderma viride]